MAIVEVKPIERLTWHKTTGKDSFKRPVTIEALVSIRTGKFSTGLSEEDVIRLSKETGYNLSDKYTPTVPHEFWNAKVSNIKLEHKTNIFNTSLPLSEIKVKVMKASDLVANSQKEYDEGKYPSAMFVIFDETEDIELRASKAAIVRKVIIESTKLTKSKKAEILQILSNTSVRNQSEDFIDLKLDEEIAKNPNKVLTLMQRDKKRTTIHSLVLEAIHKNVLRKEGSGVYYMDDQLGFDVEAAIDYLEDKKNQALKVQIIEKIN